MSSFQKKVLYWCIECFGRETSYDRQERAARFMEEALELFQSCGGSKDDLLTLAEYVYARPAEPQLEKEVGGVCVTLAALCSANGISLCEAAETELERVQGMVPQIRAKHASKPRSSPLPGDYPQ